MWNQVNDDEAWKIQDFNICEDHSLLDFTSAVQYVKYFMYNFSQNRAFSFQSLVYEKYMFS